MNRNRTLATIAFALAVSAWAFVGCDQSTGTDSTNDVSNRTQSVNLNDPYGGYNTANEKPAFGDPYLLENYGAEASNVVALADEDSTRESRMRVHRFLLVTWGNLNADSTINFPTDWSGKLCVENGLVRPVRTVRFEEPRDHLVPSTSRSCVEWVSHTQPDFDGILFALHRVPCDSLATPDSLCASPISVTFTTGPLTVTFNQDELKDLHKVIQVDAAGMPSRSTPSCSSRTRARMDSWRVSGRTCPVSATRASSAASGRARTDCTPDSCTASTDRIVAATMSSSRSGSTTTARSMES
jgi:hypothetical protein